MPFFLRGRRHENISKKVKTTIERKKRPDGVPPAKKGKFATEDDEEITSDEGEQYIKEKQVNEEEKAEEEEETAQEKKVRLARQYLKELKEQKAKDEDGDVDNAAISTQLREDLLEASGRLRKRVADTYRQPAIEDISVLKSKHQKLPITCVTVTSDDKFIFSGSKDCSIVKYTLDGKRIGSIPGGQKGTEDIHIGHTTHIFSMAVSSDGKLLASGDQGGNIHIWDAETLKHLKKFKKHRGAISGLAFRYGTHTLYSAAHDRMVMVWNLDAMAFVENLGGHQDAITGIDALMRESCITSGGRDQSVIVYMLAEDKQLRFSGHQDSIDGIKLVNDQTFITFGQDGALALWTTLKKRPHFVVKAAHGHQINGLPNWITAAAALVNTDLVASGSVDGFVRFWKVHSDGQRTLTPLFAIPLPGVINSLEFTRNGTYLLVGVGQEHKLGRWFKEKTVKNSVVVIPLKKDKCE